MNYLIGDVQGCCNALDRLLAEIGFSPSRDHFWLLGDLVNRGPQSLRTLRRLKAFGAAASCLLGNHDLHLLAVDEGAQRRKRQDTLDEILDATDRTVLLDWLCHQRLAAFEHGWLLVHAGVAPQWDCAMTLAVAAEVEAELRGAGKGAFLRVMYGDTPTRWRPGLTGHERLRFIVNVLTRIRFCDANGRLEFETKDGASAAPPSFMPWFKVPGRRPRHADRFRPLVHARPDRHARVAFAGHRLCLGRRAHGGPGQRWQARGDPGRLRTGQCAGPRKSTTRIPAGRAGDVAEWLKAAVLKTADGVTRP